MNKKYLILASVGISVLAYNHYNKKPKETQSNEMAKLKQLSTIVQPINKTNIAEDNKLNDNYSESQEFQPLLKIGRYVMEREIPQMNISLDLQDPRTLDGKLFMNLGSQGYGAYALDAVFVHGRGMVDDIKEGENQLNVQYKISQKQNILEVTVISFLYENNTKTTLPEYTLNMVHEENLAVHTEQIAFREPAGYDSPDNYEESDEYYDSFQEYGNNSEEFERTDLP